MFIKIIAFVVPLGFDTLAIAIALGFRGMEPFRPAVLFTFFEMVMPLIGILLGRWVGGRFELVAPIIGGLILIAVGIHAFREAGEEGEDASKLSFDSIRGAALAGLAISTDELAVGFPMGTSGLPIPPLIFAIGLQALIATVAGVLFGRKVGSALGRSAIRVSGTVAGIAFAAVGLWLIVEQLLSHRT